MVDFVPHFEQIEVEYEEGETREVQLHDGSFVRLRKLERDYDPTNRRAARELLLDSDEKSLFLTGLIYLEPEKRTLLDTLEMVDSPLASLDAGALRPPPETLDQVIATYR